MLNDQVLMDVALSKGEARRRWTITKWSMGWSCLRTEDHDVIVSGCATEKAMLAHRQAWEADISALHQDGWA